MSASASAIVPTARERRAFVLRKLHSLSGVFPVGAFLVLHIWTNAHALQGRAAYERAATAVSRQPNFLLLELVLVALPLAFHALWGILMTLEARPTRAALPAARQSAYVLQRVTGIVVLIFVIVHVAELRVDPAGARRLASDHFPTLCSLLSATVGGVPVRAMAYLVGLAAASYHLANGLRGFCFGWGITASRRASRRIAVASSALGLAVFALGASTVVYFATGLRLATGDGLADELGSAASCAEVATCGSAATTSPGLGALPPEAPHPNAPTAPPLPEVRP